VSDNLVKDYLEEQKIISPEQYLDYAMIDGDRWEIYKISDDTLFYVRYELIGKIGYAFCAKIVCKRMTSSFNSLYYVKSYGNEVKDNWECDKNVKDSLMSHAITLLKPY